MIRRSERAVLLLAAFLAVQSGYMDNVSANPGGIGESLAGGSQRSSQVVDSVLREIKQQARGAKYSVKVSDLGESLLLEGEVDSERGRDQIVAAASSVAGKRVSDQLRIRPTLSDDQIAERVKMALERDYPDVAKRVHLDVKDGVVHLSGDLRNHREIDELLSTTLMVEGVRDLKSDITIAGRAYYGQRQRARR
jgi:osmotically-inducible protein OsmY